MKGCIPFYVTGLIYLLLTPQRLHSACVDPCLRGTQFVTCHVLSNTPVRIDIKSNHFTKTAGERMWVPALPGTKGSFFLQSNLTYDVGIERKKVGFNPRTLMSDQVKLTGGVWRGAAIGAAIGAVAGMLVLYVFSTAMGYASPTSADRRIVISFFTFNGTGLGGLFGLLGQKRRQRLLNQRSQSLPSQKNPY